MNLVTIPLEINQVVLAVLKDMSAHFKTWIQCMLNYLFKFPIIMFYANPAGMHMYCIICSFPDARIVIESRCY